MIFSNTFQKWYSQEERILESIPLLREDHGRLEGLRLLAIHDGIGDDDNGIAHLNLASSCTIETDTTTATLTLDDIGLQALTIVIIYDLHLLASDQASGIHQVLVYCDTAHVVEVSLRNRHTMELTFQYFYLHIFLRVV